LIAEDMTKEELIELVKKLRSKRKYGIFWEDDKIREEFDTANSIPVLQELTELSINTSTNQTNHILIEGDNYPALSILKSTHFSKIDFIYIDPPYNTGNKDFKYNDAFVEKDDAYRHSKWLNFMNKRLEIAKDLLSENGIIFVSIGDDEQANLKLLMDGIFGESNHIETFIWESIFRPSNLGKSVRRNSEYVLCYVKNRSDDFSLAQKSQEAQGEASLTQNNNAPRTLTFPKNYVKVKLPDGTYKNGKYGDIEMLDDLVVKDGLAIKSFRISGKLKWKQEYLDSEVAKGVTLMIKTKSFIPYYRKDYQDTILRPTKLIPNDVVGDVLSANAEIKKIFGSSVFDYPKPTSLIKYLISICNLSENAVILDYFAGSGTTGDAVLQLNTEDSKKMQFILITNNENSICEEVTYKRIRSVISGYTDSNNKEIEGKGENLRYLRIRELAKTNNSDEMKIRLSEQVVPFIQLQENAYEKIGPKGKNFNIYRSNERIVAIHNSFDFEELVDLRDQLVKYKDLSIKLFLFSFDDEFVGTEMFSDFKYLQMEPIPSRILGILKDTYV